MGFEHCVFDDFMTVELWSGLFCFTASPAECIHIITSFCSIIVVVYTATLLVHTFKVLWVAIVWTFWVLTRSPICGGKHNTSHPTAKRIHEFSFMVWILQSLKLKNDFNCKLTLTCQNMTNVYCISCFADFRLICVFFWPRCPPSLTPSHMVSLQELETLPGPGDFRGTELGTKKFQLQKAKNQTCTDWNWNWNVPLKIQFAQFVYSLYSFFFCIFDSMVDTIHVFPSVCGGGHELLGLQVAMVSQSGKMVRYMASLMSGWLTWWFGWSGCAMTCFFWQTSEWVRRMLIFVGELLEVDFSLVHADMEVRNSANRCMNKFI